MTKSRGRPFAVIDCETDPFKHGRIPEPFLWGFYDGKEYKEFTSTGALVDFLRQMRIIIYAHNGGRFDYHFLAQYVEPFSDFLIIDGRIVSFEIWDCELRDSFSILPASLASFQKRKIDYSKLEKDKRAANAREISEYLQSDCVNLYNWIAEFIATYGRHITLARAAMKFWQTKFADNEPERTDENFYKRFAPFYFGGRVEAVRKGVFDGNFYIADINSAYPYAMKSLHASGDMFFTRENPVIRHDEFKAQNFYIIEGKSFGALPYKRDDALEFPRDGIGHMFHVSGWEITQGIETDTLDINRVICEYEFVNNVTFGGYVDHFYAIKQLSARNSAQYTFAKLFLNSLYGKFGANPETYCEHVCVPSDMIAAAKSEGYEFAGEFGQHAVVRRNIQDEQKRYYNVATAASITAAVRSILWRAYRSITDAGGAIYYCDTDSLIFECPGTPPIPCGDALGEWKIEMVCDRIAIAGKKLYAARDAANHAKWKTASKGVKLSASEIVKIAQGETITYKPEIPTFSFYSGIKFVDRVVKMT